MTIKTEKIAMNLTTNNKPDWRGFGEHLAEYEDQGIPVGRKDLVRLAAQYRTERLTMQNGKPQKRIRSEKQYYG